MNETKFEEYALLDAQIKQLTEKKEAIRTELVTNMVSAGIEKMETTLGKFTVTKLKKWSYPEYVTDMNDAFKAAKAKAESTGEATYTEEESLRFTSLSL